MKIKPIVNSTSHNDTVVTDNDNDDDDDNAMVFHFIYKI